MMSGKNKKLPTFLKKLLTNNQTYGIIQSERGKEILKMSPYQKYYYERQRKQMMKRIRKEKEEKDKKGDKK